MDLKLNPDFREFIELLNANKVDYLVIGGFAVNFHGYPRFTRDIDFWIWMTEENIQKLLQALRDFGFGSLGLDHTDFKDAESVIQLGYEPNRIDLLVDVNGLDFAECFQRKEDQTIENTAVHFIHLNDLIKAKEIAARPQDLADAHELKAIAAKSKNTK